MRKIRPQADFFLNVPRSGTYRVGEADISYKIYRAEGISRAEGTQKVNTIYSLCEYDMLRTIYKCDMFAPRT